jgi:hypothetical protein
VDAARGRGAFALGQGWNFWAQEVPVATRVALAELALRSARADGVDRRWAQQLLHDWRFRLTEEARGVLETLRKELTAPGAAAALPRARLADWVQLTVGGMDEAAKAALVDALKVRWRAAQDDAERNGIAGLVMTLLPSSGRAEARIAFLRERLERADADHKRRGGRALDALTSAPGRPRARTEGVHPRGVAARLGTRTPATPCKRSAVSARELAVWVHEGPAARRARHA